MQLTHFLLLTGAICATAHPSGHAHLHRAVHSKRNGELTFMKAVHNVAPEEPSSSAPPPPPAETPKPPPPPASTPAPKPQNVATTPEYKPFCGRDASKKAKRVTEEQIHYEGNIGTANGCPWNSNMMVVPNEIDHMYKYVQHYTNEDSVPYQVVCANKIGSDHKLTGMFHVDYHTPLIFNLQPGETKTLVTDEDTQGVCAFAPHEVPLTSHGQYAGVWAEFDSGNTSNGGWSGADCSALVAQAYEMDVPGCRMSEGGVDSTIFPGGRGDNAYTRGMEALDGIGLNINVGKFVMKVKVGFQG